MSSAVSAVFPRIDEIGYVKNMKKRRRKWEITVADKSETRNVGIEKKILGRKSGECDSDKKYDSG